MEPLSALSVATAVVQLLDFSGKIIAGTYRIYKSKLEESEKDSPPHSDIISITKSLVGLNNDLQDYVHRLDKINLCSQDQNIAVLGIQCNKLGDRLICVLNMLKVQEPPHVEKFQEPALVQQQPAIVFQIVAKIKEARRLPRAWESFQKAMLTVLKQTEIDDLRRDLDSYRQQISMHILVSLREYISSKERNQSQHNLQTQKTLDETRSICDTIFTKIHKNFSWRSDLVEAINWNYAHLSLKVDDPQPARLHELLGAIRNQDVHEMEMRVLHHLQFVEMDIRREKVAIAHQKTFEWIFSPPLSHATWSDFVQWIQGDTPMYWITGKAGAGKSTLMRFINDDKRTQQALQVWAAGDPLVTTYFFFWNSGTKIQMSYEGLVRTLLYQILEQYPGMITILFPRRVEHFTYEQQPWSWEELLKAFRTLIQKLTETTKLVFFIDGMDEFIGEPCDLIDFITSLVAPNVKICASSRPWNAFEDAFGTRPHLRLEDLSFEDIRYYVTSKFNASPGYLEIQQFNPQFSSELIENVCKRSSGVFLWVALATRSLLEGVSEGERLPDLQRRLDLLPKDLEDLFRKMLEQLDSNHLARASQLFQLIRASILPISLLHLSFADEEDPEVAIKLPCGPLTSIEIDSRTKLMGRRINACCRGLLEASSHNNSTVNPHTRIVTYLHRTVRDYLEREEVWTRLCRATDKEFNPNWRLCNSQIMRLKAKAEQTDSGVVTHGIEYAIRADPKCCTCQVSLIDEIQRAMQQGDNALINRGYSHAGSSHFIDFLEFAVKCGLDNYVQATLGKMPQSLLASCISRLLYSSLLTQNYPILNIDDLPAIHYGQPPSQNLVKCLLDHGADPHLKLETHSSWFQAIAIYSSSLNGAILEEFLLHGADPRDPHLNAIESRLTDDIAKLIKRKKRETRWSHYIRKSWT